MNDFEAKLEAKAIAFAEDLVKAGGFAIPPGHKLLMKPSMYIYAMSYKAGYRAGLEVSKPLLERVERDIRYFTTNAFTQGRKLAVECLDTIQTWRRVFTDEKH